MKFGLLAWMILVAAVLVLLERAGFWIWFGAHPSWSAQGVMIGIGIGLVLTGIGVALVKWRVIGQMKVLAMFVVLTLIAIACTKFGKMGFVNSYAENQLAGKFWYFGYMGQMGTIFATLVALLQLGQKRLAKNL